MKIQTPRCTWCDKSGFVEVDDAEGRAFESGIGHIQDAMPTTPAPIREQLITGTHPKCWDEMMAESDVKVYAYIDPEECSLTCDNAECQVRGCGAND